MDEMKEPRHSGITNDELEICAGCDYRLVFIEHCAIIEDLESKCERYREALEDIAKYKGDLCELAPYEAQEALKDENE